MGIGADLLAGRLFGWGRGIAHTALLNGPKAAPCAPLLHCMVYTQYESTRLLGEMLHWSRAANAISGLTVSVWAMIEISEGYD